MVRPRTLVLNELALGSTKASPAGIWRIRASCTLGSALPCP
jgi:hypothetical protein